METVHVFSICTTNIIALLIIILIIYRQRSKTGRKAPENSKLPPGKYGWPVIGETRSYMSCPAKFIRDRMLKYSPDVFKTSLAGEKMIIFCGPKANKFLFSNEGTLVNYWLPRSVAGALSYPKPNNESSAYGKPVEELSYKLLKKETIQHYVAMVDSMVQKHLGEYWFPNQEVKAYSLAKEFTFALSCRVFVNASVGQVKDIAKPFYSMLDGLFSAPINFPGMPYYKAIKGGRLVREKLVEIIKERRAEILFHKNNNYYDEDNKELDLLSRLIYDSNRTSKDLSDEEIASKIVGLLFAGFYPTSTTIAFLISNLAQHPRIYERVFQEQIKIAQSKGNEVPLSWANLREMKYSWNVICETMRLASPVPGNFREVKSNFNYAGFSIPKGCKVHWTVHTTHTNPEYFPDPEKFDPSRFEGSGPTPYTYVPFGAGPRMCVGMEFARIEILVFLHNVVTTFKFKKMNPNEKIIYKPDPTPTEGLSIFLESHKC